MIIFPLYRSVEEDDFKWTIKCKCRQFLLEIVFVMPSPAVCHTQQQRLLAQGNRRQQQLTFLSFLFHGRPPILLYKSVLFGWTDGVCKLLSDITTTPSIAITSVRSCIIIKVLDRSGTQTCFSIYILYYTGTDWDGRFDLFLILGGQTFGEYLPRRKSCYWANGKCI